MQRRIKAGMESRHLLFDATINPLPDGKPLGGHRHPLPGEVFEVTAEQAAQLADRLEDPSIPTPADEVSELRAALAKAEAERDAAIATAPAKADASAAPAKGGK